MTVSSGFVDISRIPPGLSGRYSDCSTGPLETRLSNRSRTVLVVATTPSLASSLACWLDANGYASEVVRTYPAGKLRLEDRPSALITELELGAYNGLQLALHARSEDVTPIVIGPADVVLERDAAQLGITYIQKGNLTGTTLKTAIRHDEICISAAIDQVQVDASDFEEITRRVPHRVSIH